MNCPPAVMVAMWVCSPFNEFQVSIVLVSAQTRKDSLFKTVHTKRKIPGAVQNQFKIKKHHLKKRIKKGLKEKNKRGKEGKSGEKNRIES